MRNKPKNLPAGPSTTAISFDLEVGKSVHDEAFIDFKTMSGGVVPKGAVTAEKIEELRNLFKSQMHAYYAGMNSGVLDQLAKYQHPSLPDLTKDEQCWQKAMIAVLGTSGSYSKFTPEERRKAEERYTTLAKKNSPDGRRAQRVVAARVAASLADDKPPFEINRIKSPTGRVLKGRRPDMIIIDDVEKP